MFQCFKTKNENRKNNNLFNNTCLKSQAIKYWLLVDVSISYWVKLNIYLGEENENAAKETDVGEKAVLKLCQPYFKSNRCITGYNFFTSVSLENKLWEENLTYVGTLWANKPEIPEAF